MILIKNLSKSFNEKTVIRDLSIAMPDYGTIAICGPSGCGKSTLLNILALTEPFDGGQIDYGKKDIIFSVSFQDPHLLPGRSAEQNVNLVLGDKKSTVQVARHMLSDLGISDFAAYPDELSGGMKARVGIARALAFNADIYLFDEPFANLDAETARMVTEIIKNKTAGKLCIAVIHDLSLAAGFADTVVKFSDTPLTSYETIGTELPSI